jgi:multiple sugar transport system substrate-binding protein
MYRSEAMMLNARNRRGGRALVLAGLLVLVLAAAGCPARQDGATASSGGTTGEPMALDFWHTRTQSEAKALEAIVADFNTANPDVKITPRYQGNYTQLFQKVTASIQTHQLPALAVAYESFVADYMSANIVVPLDDYLKDPKYGLSAESLADIYPAYLQTNRFPQFNNQLLSFPFTKSNLMLYYNRDLLQKAGFQAPPATWDEFTTQCQAIKKQTGKPVWAVDVDASTVDGIIYSFGGELLSEDRKQTLFDSPPALKMFELYDRLFRGGWAYQVGHEDLVNEFANGNAAFILTSSTQRPVVERQSTKPFNWDLAIIPHGPSAKPVTVMYGANICIFKSTPEKQTAAWRFIQYFTSTPITARWATQTGYLPVRKSAASDPALTKFFSDNPRARRAFDVLPNARPEPNVAGWQEVRIQIGEAVTSVINAQASPQEAARTLKKKADAVIGKT